MRAENFEQPLSLEEQFENKEKIELHGGEVDVVDIEPERKKTEVPVVVAPGWLATAERFKKNIMTHAQEGRRTICVDTPHGADSQSLEGEDIGDYPEVELRKVAALIEILDAKDIDKVDAVGHSEAGINLAIAAKLYPEKFRNIVLVDPGGMIGRDNLRRLTIGYLKDASKETINALKNPELIKPSVITKHVEGGKAFLKDPIRSVKEAKAISDTQIHELLKRLKELGIGISVIHGVDDEMFPMDRVQKVADPDQLDGFYSVKGTHNQLTLEPEKYSKLADQALDALEKKRNT